MKKKKDYTKYRETDRARRLGTTVEAINEIISASGGKCGACEKPLEPLLMCIDHDHKTGTLRGVLCRNCNAGIGLLGDDLDGLLKAVAYLRRVHERLRLRIA